MAKDPKVPNTISDKQMADLRARAEKVAPPMFSKQAIDRRHAAADQRSKRNAS